MLSVPAEAALSMPDTDPAPRRLRLRIALGMIAAIELLDRLSSLPNIFHDYHQTTAYMRFAQTLTSVQLGVTPLIAAAVLVLAAIGRLREAIVGLATLVLTVWLLDDLPSMPIHGLEFSWTYGGIEVFVHHVMFPLLAIAGATLALKNRWLALAGLLVSLPTLINWAGMVAFTIAVMIYGF